MAQIGDEVLVYDIETRTYGSPDPDKDKLKLFGCYSYKTNKFYLLSSVEDIQKVVNAHKFLVGFNTETYDEPIVKRAGVNIEYKIRMDLYDIIKKRAAVIKIKEGLLKDLLMSYSLDYITKTLKLVNEEEGKKKIDYNLFMKDSWTEEELKIIKEYTLRDVEVTKKLYEWIEDYFEGFRDFIGEDDVKKKKYLTVGVPKYAYKAICKALKWTEEYEGNGVNHDDDESISGGYVSFPSSEEFHETDTQNVYVLDFTSLYPHIMMQCNLHGRNKHMATDNRPVWNGNGVWKVEGFYYADTLSGVGELIKKWFKDRVEYKRVKDKREYTIKIILNIFYGILNTPYYIKVCDGVAGGDCTRIGRQWIRYARKTFRDAGYGVAYTDTDSIYIVDPFKDKEKMLAVKKGIIDFIKSTVPFPQDTFDMALEAEIKHLFFFKGENISEKDEEMDEDDFINKSKQLMKKNYIYVKKDGEVVIKNLGIRKKSNTPLSRKIFWDYLVPQIKDGKIKFTKAYLRGLIMELLQKDITLAALRKDVGPLEDYKKSPNGLQAQISAKYGQGIHFLIPNLKGVGVGKGKSYCTIEEFHKHNLRLEHIDLENVFNELEYFTKSTVNVNIFSFGS
jgi:DNA polymerase elongation subunit (family B)